MTNIISLFEDSRTFKPGEMIIREGEENRDLYILSRGVLEVSVKNDVASVIVSEVQSPEILGELSFLNGTPRTATVIAKTDVEVFILSYEKAKQDISDIPTWFKLVLGTLTNRMRSCDEKIKEYDHKIKDLESEIERLKQN
jgi:CRP-like cAMP-binding protein